MPLPLLGDSEGALRGREALDRAAGGTHPVIIVAEPGCRPRDVARALHLGSRPAQPFIGLGSDPEGPALAVRLFGSLEHAGPEGDFTTLGSDSALLAAGGGTLFIDDLDDLPASAQRTLARVLRDGEVGVPGTAQPVSLGCRVVAATSTGLGADARDGRLRDDLLRRFQQSIIRIPPLRQRPADLAVIVERLVKAAGAPARTFTQAALTVLAALPWSRNIDELAATLGPVLSSAGPTVRQEDVLAHLPIENAFTKLDTTATLKDARRRFEREYIEAVLERHRWKMSEAARTLGIERANLYRKARQLGISRTRRVEVP
ncbi:MAG: sigma-54-dependent Fis family transcriptional regulator [Acidobacteria bacterium]|nr:sigma-54-dependent Fis family transcriptional regulator [Acidobacteriota bacterium]